MKNFNISKSDIEYFINKRKNYYFAFLLCVIIGLVIGIIISKTTDEYMSVLSYSDKYYFSLVKGEVNLIALASRIFLVFSVSLLILFLTSLNYYTSYISYFIITYQTILLTLSVISITNLYAFIGFVVVLLIIIPVNLIDIVINIYCSTNFIIRSERACRLKQFSYGFDKEFFVQNLLAYMALAALSIYAGIVVPLIIKNANFIIF